jgi:NCS1 family nucleobase:cation symporter-1
MIWAVVSSHGADFQGLGQKQASGAVLAWGFLQSVNSIVSNVIPPLVNIPDLARYARQPRDTWPMPVGLLLSKPLVVLIGVVTTAAGYKQFGKASNDPCGAFNTDSLTLPQAYWNLWDFYSSVLDNYWSPGTRTIVFLGAGIQAFATFATNISSNSIPVGCDLAGLFPRYFTIVRGQILCFCLAWVCGRSPIQSSVSRLHMY